VGWPTSGEIDVMEQPLIQLNQNAGSLHYSTTGGGCCSNHQTFTKLFTNTDQLSSAFHTFGILWQPNLITFYFDGQPYGQLDKNSTSTNFWPFNAPEFLIFDNSTPGDPVTMNWQSSTMVVDYVRLWKADGLGSAWTH
jgi:beta-glucanase (GH16 family)